MDGWSTEQSTDGYGCLKAKWKWYKLERSLCLSPRMAATIKIASGASSLYRNNKEKVWFISAPVSPFLSYSSARVDCSVGFLSECNNSTDAQLAGSKEPRFELHVLGAGQQESCLSSDARLGFSLMTVGYRKARIWLWKGRKSAVFMPCLASPTLPAQ